MSSRAAEGKKQESTTNACRSPMITVVLPPPLCECSISYTPSASLVTFRCVWPNTLVAAKSTIERTESVEQYQWPTSCISHLLGLGWQSAKNGIECARSV